MEDTNLVGGNLMMDFDLSDHLLSAEEVENNVDLLIMILLQMPAKSLVRFKCISKHWLSIISNSKFCNDHTRKNLSPAVLGLYVDSSPLFDLKGNLQNGQHSLPKLDFLNTSAGKKFMILHSCNGLILCSHGSEIVVCNPTIQKFLVVPSFDRYYTRMILSFSPLASPNFKVVSIYCKTIKLIGNDSPTYSYDIDIYSSESGYWETIPTIGSEYEPFDRFTHYVLCDGALYWLAVGNKLMRFDIDAENMTTHETPREPLFLCQNTVLYFGKNRQHLSLVQSSPFIPKVFHILEMDTHNFRWTPKYAVDLDQVIYTSFPKSYNQRWYVLYFKGLDEEETFKLLVARQREILLYSPKSRQNILQDLPRPIERKMGFKPVKVDEFVASLALF